MCNLFSVICPINGSWGCFFYSNVNYDRIARGIVMQFTGNFTKTINDFLHNMSARKNLMANDSTMFKVNVISEIQSNGPTQSLILIQDAR